MNVCLSGFQLWLKCCVCVQVSRLEQQLERDRAALQEEVRNRERDVQGKDKELQEMIRHNAQVSDSAK